MRPIDKKIQQSLNDYYGFGWWMVTETVFSLIYFSFDGDICWFQVRCGWEKKNYFFDRLSLSHFFFVLPASLVNLSSPLLARSIKHGLLLCIRLFHYYFGYDGRSTVAVTLANAPKEIKKRLWQNVIYNNRVLWFKLILDCIVCLTI